MAPTVEGEDNAEQPTNGTNNVVKFRDPKPNAEREKARQSAKQKRSSFRDSRISQTSTDVYHKKHAGTLYIKKTNMNDELEDYDNKFSNICGIIQIVIGILCIILGIVSIVIKCTGAMIGFGIWGGAVIIASGALGVISYKSPIARLIISCFAMSLIALVIGGLIFIIMCVFVSSDINTEKTYRHEQAFWPAGSSMSESSRKLADAQVPKIAVDCLLLILGLVQIVVAAVQAILAGKVFILRGPLEEETTPTATTPLRDMGGAGDGWGEYNPQPKKHGDQEAGEHKPKRSSRKQKPEEQTSGSVEKEQPQVAASPSEVKVEVEA